MHLSVVACTKYYDADQPPWSLELAKVWVLFHHLGEGDKFAWSYVASKAGIDEALGYALKASKNGGWPR